MSFKNTLKNARILAYGLALAGLVATQPKCNSNYSFNPYENIAQVSAQEIEKQGQAQERVQEKQVQTVQKPKVQKISSLETLAKQGLPQEFKDMGFTLGDYVNKGTEKEIIIITDNHHYADPHRADKLREKQARLIRHLAEKHHADSIGLEKLSGTGPNLYNPDEKVTKLYEKFSALINNRGINLPFYGIEDKPLLELEEFLGDNYFRKKERVIQELKKTKGLPENIESELCFDSNNKLDFGNWIKFSISERSKSFGKNITAHLKNTSSKRTIVIFGGAHSYAPITGLKRVQEYIPYSNLTIHSPESTKEDIEYLLKKNRDAYELLQARAKQVLKY